MLPTGGMGPSSACACDGMMLASCLVSRAQSDPSTLCPVVFRVWTPPQPCFWGRTFDTLPYCRLPTISCLTSEYSTSWGSNLMLILPLLISDKTPRRAPQADEALARPGRKHLPTWPSEERAARGDEGVNGGGGGGAGSVVFMSLTDVRGNPEDVALLAALNGRVGHRSLRRKSAVRRRFTTQQEECRGDTMCVTSEGYGERHLEAGSPTKHKAGKGSNTKVVSPFLRAAAGSVHALPEWSALQARKM